MSGRIFLETPAHFAGAEVPRDKSVAEPQTASHAPRLGLETDVDVFRFDAKAGQTWVIETQAAQRGSPVDTKIEVLRADGKPVERLLLQAVRNSAINFRSIDFLSIRNSMYLTVPCSVEAFSLATICGASDSRFRCQF